MRRISKSIAHQSPSVDAAGTQAANYPFSLSKDRAAGNYRLADKLIQLWGTANFILETVVRSVVVLTDSLFIRQNNKRRWNSPPTPSKNTTHQSDICLYNI
jgi:hypothetical protein